MHIVLCCVQILICGIFFHNTISFLSLHFRSYFVKYLLPDKNKVFIFSMYLKIWHLSLTWCVCDIILIIDLIWINFRFPDFKSSGYHEGSFITSPLLWESKSCWVSYSVCSFMPLIPSLKLFITFILLRPLYIKKNSYVNSQPQRCYGPFCSGHFIMFLTQCISFHVSLH